MALLVLKIFTLIFGLGIIISGFIIFGDSLKISILTLNIIVSCIIYLQFAQLFFSRMININKDAQKEVGILGIQYTVVCIYSISSIIIMLIGDYFQWPFKLQLLWQLILFFLLLVGVISSLLSGNKVESTYNNEQGIRRGKKSLSDSMKNLIDDVINTKNVDTKVIEQLNHINKELRFISPSSNPLAQKLDMKFNECISSISVMLRDTSLNVSAIEKEVNQLEQIFIQRKKY